MKKVKVYAMNMLTVIVQVYLLSVMSNWNNFHPCIIVIVALFVIEDGLIAGRCWVLWKFLSIVCCTSFTTDLTNIYV